MRNIDTTWGEINPRTSCTRTSTCWTPMPKSAGAMPPARLDHRHRYCRGWRRGWLCGCGTTDAGLGHPGPVLAYLSKAPGPAARNACWRRRLVPGIELGAADALKWKMTLVKQVGLSIPANISPGRYLLRIGQIWPTRGSQLHAIHQLYPDQCRRHRRRQLGPAGQVPGSLGEAVRTALWREVDDDLAKYTMPGPTLWVG